MNSHWIADRMRHIELSGIRKIFDLTKNLKDPVNLSIGQPHFDVPPAVKQAAIQAITDGQNGYTVTQGIAAFRERILADVRKQYRHADRDVLVTSGTSGGLLLALAAVVNPGDEVILFDPYFVAYPHMVTLVGGVSKFVDTYPHFQVDVDRVKAAITPRTKVILACSPANPTGIVLTREIMRDLAKLAAERGILLISDEIYRAFCYDEPFVSPAEFNENVLVVDGFSKSHAMTGWRLGHAHGPTAIIQEMAKLQQFTFVCAPSMAQHGGLAALECDTSGYIADYRRKRDRIVAGLAGHFDLVRPQGAFYLFPRVPSGTATEFVTECLHNKLLVIPGSVFSGRDTHFRISYAAEDATIEKGIAILKQLATGQR